MTSNTDLTCSECGCKGYSTLYAKSEITAKMKTHNLCWNCAYWKVEIEKPHDLVIDGHIYSIGPGDADGMGGRKFDIEYFNGKKITTHDLWSGGPIPEKYLTKIPNTAKFINGASTQKVGDILYWNASE